MIRTLAAIAAVGALALAGCASLSSTAPVTGGLTLAQVEREAALAAKGLCAVAPTAESITSIILASTGNAAGQLSEHAAQAAATAFCSGVTGAKAKRGVVHRRGVPVALGGGVIDYGTLTIAGRVIALQGTPAS